jgi:molecular chaperone DnaK (HSP70)
MTAKAVGIDLGTTYSCVGVWQNDRVEIIGGLNTLGEENSHVVDLLPWTP